MKLSSSQRTSLAKNGPGQKKKGRCEGQVVYLRNIQKTRTPETWGRVGLETDKKVLHMYL